MIENIALVAETRRQARAWMAAKARENAAQDEPDGFGGWRWNREDCYTGARFDRLRII